VCEKRKASAKALLDYCRKAEESFRAVCHTKKKPKKERRGIFVFWGFSF